MARHGMFGLIRLIARVQVVLALLVFAIVMGPLRAERLGDRVQIALPLIAWACEGASARGAEFALRFGAMWVTAHASKRLLGDAEMNQRPVGGDQGFPSAHTSASVLGASALVHGCLKAAPVAQGVVVIAAAFVGGSRIDAGKHDIWQVLAGALLGLGCDRLLRADGPVRRGVAQRLAWVRRGVWGGLVRVPGVAALLRSVALARLTRQSA